MDVGVSRAFFVAKNAEEKAKAVETRFANQQRLVKAASAGRTRAPRACCRSTTLDAAGDSALFGTPDQIAAKLEMLRSAGIEYLLLNGPTGSRETSAPSPATSMPAFTGCARGAPSATADSANLIVHKPIPLAFGGIPPLIKRNTVLFALSQSFVGAGTQLAYGIGPLMVIAVTGSASLAGSRSGCSASVGSWCPTRSARSPPRLLPEPGILFGQGLALIGSFVSGLAMLAGSAIGLTLGMIIFTSGISAGSAVARRRDRYVPAAPARAGAGLHRHRLARRHCAEPA